MKICRNCGTELSDQAIFCHECGASDATGVESRPPTESRQPLTLSKEVFYVVIIALALMGILVVGLAVRRPRRVCDPDSNELRNKLRNSDAVHNL